MFRNKQIICVEYDDLSHDQEREIFQVRAVRRAALSLIDIPQRGSNSEFRSHLQVRHGCITSSWPNDTWSSTERMQAICGPWPDLVREIQQCHFNQDGFASNIDWDRTRGRDFSCIASILHLIFHHSKSGKMTFPGAPQVEKLLQQRDVIGEETKGDIMLTFEILCRLVKDEALSSCFKAQSRLSPVEMIMTGYFIYDKRNDLSLPGMSCVIERMRAHVRKKHTDVRANGTVAKTIWSFVHKRATLQGLPKDDPLPAAQRLGLEAKEALLAKKDAAIRSAKIPRKRKHADTDTEASSSKTKKGDADSEPPSKMRKCESPPVDEQKAKRTGSGVTVTKRAAGTSGTAKKPVVGAKSSSSADVKGAKASTAASTSRTKAKPKVEPKTEPSAQTARRRSANPRRIDSPASPEVARTQATRSPAKRRPTHAASTTLDRLAALRAAQAGDAPTSAGPSTISGDPSTTSAGQGSSASAGPSRPSVPPQNTASRSSTPASDRKSVV